jgi:uridine phosphorylase
VDSQSTRSGTTAQGSTAPLTRGGPYSPADLPIDAEGRIYHLQIKPEHLAPDILLVGDPGRADYIGCEFLRDVELRHEHRGLVTVTGTADVTGERATVISPLRATATTSGIGTPSLEIVVSELVALAEIDFETRTLKPEFPRLTVLRLGTSGALQASTRLGTPIITTYAIGLDSTGLFYEAAHPDEVCERLESELAELVGATMSEESRFFGRIYPYVSRAAPALVDALEEAAESVGVEAKPGMTVSSCGFFAPQGRDTSRLKPSVPDVDKLLSDYDPRVGGQRIENMEMEASFLCHLLGGLGHWAGAICPTIAHRRENTFDHHYLESIRNATEVALLALAILRSRDPEVLVG